MAGLVWRPWESAEEKEVEVSESGRELQSSQPARKRVTIGEKERSFVIKCYNQCSGKDWMNVLRYLQQHILESGLPDRVVHMYLTQNEQKMTGRMSRIVKQALQTSAHTSASKSIESSPSQLVSKEMRYARPMTPKDRAAEAVKSKLKEQMRDTCISSDDSSDSQEEAKSRKKRQRKDEAQVAHTKLCKKAMAMDSVQSMI